MDSIIQMFHIDVKLLLAQVFNFAIVFFVLYKFAIKPLQETMKKRTNKIEESLENAKKVEEKLEQASVEYDRIITKARREANDIMDKSRMESEKKQNQAIEKARRDIGVIINDEKQKMQAEKQKVLEEIKKESAVFIANALEKVLEKKVDNKEDQELIKKTINL